MSDQLLFNIGITLVLAGFLVTLVAVVLLFLKTFRGEGRVRGGGVVVIGPFPMVFGTDKESVTVLLILSIVLVALVLIVMLLSHHVFE